MKNKHKSLSLSLMKRSLAGSLSASGEGRQFETCFDPYIIFFSQLSGPWLPEPESLVLRPWRVSQVRYPVALPGGAACLPLRPAAGGRAAPALVLAGDAFSPLGSRFDGCVQSGESAAAAVLAALVGT